jgi:hypothetical protein
MERSYYSQPPPEKGESIQGERVTDEQPAETPAPAPPATPDPAPDARSPQYRSRPTTPEGEAYQLLLKAGVPEKEAAARAFGLTAPVAPAAADTPAPAPTETSALPPAAAALAAHDAELDRIEQALADAKAAYDPDAETAAFMAHSKALRARQELVNARDREAANAVAAQQAAWEEAEQRSTAKAFDTYPGLDNPNGAHRQQFNALWDKLEAENDPRLHSSDRVFIIATESAAAMFAASLTRSASAPASAPSRGVPAPVPAARFSPATAGAAAPPATPQLSDDLLEDMPEAMFRELTAKTVAGINGSLARR